MKQIRKKNRIGVLIGSRFQIVLGYRFSEGFMPALCEETQDLHITVASFGEKGTLSYVWLKIIVKVFAACVWPDPFKIIKLWLKSINTSQVLWYSSVMAYVWPEDGSCPLRHLHNYLFCGMRIIFSDLEQLCLFFFFIDSSAGLHMLTVYLLCGSDKLNKNVFHIKGWF